MKKQHSNSFPLFNRSLLWLCCLGVVFTITKQAKAQCAVAASPAAAAMCTGGNITLSANATGITANSNSVLLDGINDYVSVPHSSTISLTANFTLEAWIYPTQFSNLAGIVAKYHTPGANGYTMRLNNVSPFSGVGAGGSTNVFSPNGVLALNTWSHVACVWTGSTVTIYVNGNQVATGNCPVSANTNILAIGLDYLTVPRYFKGRIDEVRIWNTPLTATTLLNWKNNLVTSLHPNYANLMAYYQFEEGSGTIAADASGNGNDGTLLNGAAWSGVGAPADYPITYSWTPTAGLSSTTTATTVATPSASTTYTVQATNGITTCSTTVAVTVNAAPSAVVTATGPTNICQGDSVTLEATTGIGNQYQWLLNGTAISGATSPTFAATQAGNYAVQVTSSSSCMATSATVAVSVAPAVTALVTAAGPLTFCQGGSVMISATAGTGYQFQWLINGNPLPNDTLANLIANQSGNYAVQVSNNHNCQATSAAIPVTVNPNPMVNVTASAPLIFCAGGTLTLSATPGYQYQWMNNNTILANDTTATLTVMQSGNYHVSVTDANLCTSQSLTSVVTVNPLPSVSMAPLATIAVDQPSFTLTGGTPAGGMYSGAGVVNGIFSPPSAGVGTHTITYTYTDANGCSTTATQAITVTVGTGVADALKDADFNVYPNPATGLVTIAFASGNTQPRSLRVIDMTGRTLQQMQAISAAMLADQTLQLNLSGLPRGLYLLHLETTSGTARKTIVLE